MVIATLKDGTEFNIDTDSESMARMIVEHKLRDRLDYRKIKKTKLVSGARMDSSHKNYNSGQWGDRQPLSCSSGWSYKWDDGKCAEFR